MTSAMNLGRPVHQPQRIVSTEGFYAPLVLHLAVRPGRIYCQVAVLGPSSCLYSPRGRSVDREWVTRLYRPAVAESTSVRGSSNWPSR
jgi:hypothetical protein